jgi:hypothetical protein
MVVYGGVWWRMHGVVYDRSSGSTQMLLNFSTFRVNGNCPYLPQLGFIFHLCILDTEFQ